MPSRESGTERQRIAVSGPTALGDAVAAARRYAADLQLDERDRARLCIIVEELITNLCEHGAREMECEIGIELWRDSGAVGLAVEDNGAPFDPRTASIPDAVPARGGGAGLRLVTSWAQVVGYEYAGGRNRIELRLPLAEG